MFTNDNTSYTILLEIWNEDLLFQMNLKIKFGSSLLRKTCCILDLRRTKEGILEEFLYNS